MINKYLQKWLKETVVISVLEIKKWCYDHHHPCPQKENVAANDNVIRTWRKVFYVLSAHNLAFRTPS